ncbi:hypothetical protein V6N11_040273 [Hibiscus sabdariffa]|uniref:Protein phosphatase n=1 Tax=Hibiscus sabdariffa TaxID=183260 RepID=A0ABR2RGZ4_9ROSI
MVIYNFRYRVAIVEVSIKPKSQLGVLFCKTAGSPSLESQQWTGKITVYGRISSDSDLVIWLRVSIRTSTVPCSSAGAVHDVSFDGSYSDEQATSLPEQYGSISPRRGGLNLITGTNFLPFIEFGDGSFWDKYGQDFRIPVLPGDVIVAGTDGLFDNLYNNEVTDVVVHASRAGLSPESTAKQIAALARERAVDKNRQSPFAKAAQDAGFRYNGGKLDDITVVSYSILLALPMCE